MSHMILELLIWPLKFFLIVLILILTPTTYLLWVVTAKMKTSHWVKAQLLKVCALLEDRNNRNICC